MAWTAWGGHPMMVEQPLPQYAFTPSPPPPQGNIYAQASGYYNPDLLTAYNSAQLGNRYNTEDYNTGLGRLAGQLGIDTANLGTSRDRTVQDIATGDTRAGQDNTQNQLYNNQDYSRGTARNDQDYGITTGRLSEDYGINSGRLTEDYGTNTGRENEDFGINTQRAGEDHTNSINDLLRSYKNLAGQQLQTQNAAGLLHSGAGLQAAAKRDANEAHDQAPIDLGFARQTQDLNLGHGRTLADLTTNFGRGQQDLSLNLNRGTQDASISHDRTGEDLTTNRDRSNTASQTAYNRQHEDAATGTTRANQDYDTGLGQLTFNNTNATHDLTTGYNRGVDAYGNFLTGNAGQVAYQATQNGYMPPAPRPSNEFGSGANAYRVIIANGERLTVDQHGNILSRRPA